MRYVKQFVKQTNINVLLKQSKLEADESIDIINEWNLTIEGKIEQGDAEIDRLEH